MIYPLYVFSVSRVLSHELHSWFFIQIPYSHISGNLQSAMVYATI